MEAIPEGEQVLTGTFSLNGHPIIILFDSGATHDFISKAYTQEHQLLIAHTHTPYMISTPGGNIITKHVILSIALNLAGKLYKTSFIVLDGQGIDVILGMRWIKVHKSLLDTVAQVVHLDSPIHSIDVLQLSSSSSVATPSVHHNAAQNLGDIPVSYAFPDVFLEDLPGMPLNQDVEFTIELQPDIVSISRQSYKMTHKELVELNI
jgi:hypothetical protein